VFREAAARHAEERRLADGPLEDKIMHWLRRYMAEWKADLDARPAVAQATSVGRIVRR